MATTDTLKIGAEIYTGVTDAASIIAKVNANDASLYTATAAGEVITLTQKVAAAGTAPTVTISGVDVVPATAAKFVFTVTTALATIDTLKIGTETYTGVTDAASIIAKVNANGASLYRATAAGEVITLTQKIAAAGAIPTVAIDPVGTGVVGAVTNTTPYKAGTPAGVATGGAGIVSNPTPYAASTPTVPATSAKFVFTVTKALATTDTLKIGTETYTGVTDAASIIAKVNANGTSAYTAAATGEVITLTQKVAAPGGVPTVTVN